MKQSIKSIDSDTLALLMNNQMFDGFTGEEVLGFCAIMQAFFRSVPRDAVVIAEGAAANFAGIVCKGKISATKVTGDGNEHILALHEKGDLMGLDGALTSPFTSPMTFTALEDSEVLFLGVGAVFSEKLDPVMANRILRNLNRMLADKCVRLLYKTEVLSKRSLRVRIMTYLRIQQRKQGTNTLDLKMDREQFAQYLCVNRSALSRELSGMQRDGLIRFEPDGAVTMKDPDF